MKRKKRKSIKGTNKKKSGRLLDGKTYDEMPTSFEARDQTMWAASSF